MLESNIGYEFQNKRLLAQILIRKSAVNEGLASVEFDEAAFSRIKFIGTHLLGLLASHLLFTTQLFSSEENLTRALTKIISHDGLIVKAALQIQLGDSLIVGQGEKLNEFYNNPHVLAEHLQALLGAVWIDCQRDMTVLIRTFRKIFSFAREDSYRQHIIELPDGIAPPSNFGRLQYNLGYVFHDMNLLLNACVRRSALEERVVSSSTSFQTLEFLGDKVLGCITADWLLQNLETDSADSLVPIFNVLVSNHTLLPQIAQHVGLGPSLILGEGEEKQAVRQNQRKLADHLEALIAAMWLDTQHDYQHTYGVVYRLFSQQLCEIVSQDKSERFKLITTRVNELTAVAQSENSGNSEEFPALLGSNMKIASEALETTTSYLTAAMTSNDISNKVSTHLDAVEQQVPSVARRKTGKLRLERDSLFGSNSEQFPSLPTKNKSTSSNNFHAPTISYRDVATRGATQQKKKPPSQQLIYRGSPLSSHSTKRNDIEPTPLNISENDQFPSLSNNSPQ